MANKTSADDAVEKHNANNLKDVKKCKECGEYFWQTDEERTWFADRNMKAPYYPAVDKTKSFRIIGS